MRTSRFTGAVGAVAALVALVAACGGNPQPGDPGYSFNLNGPYTAEFAADDGSLFRGTIDIETLAGGLVAGSMSLDDPMVIAGTVEGTIIGAQLTLEVAYSIPDTGCSGVASGTGIIDEGGIGAAGSLAVVDECGDAPPSLAFTLTR